jgi:hypothetical protein
MVLGGESCCQELGWRAVTCEVGFAASAEAAADHPDGIREHDGDRRDVAATRETPSTLLARMVLEMARDGVVLDDDGEGGRDVKEPWMRGP